jgi:hypothetical protein
MGEGRLATTGTGLFWAARNDSGDLTFYSGQGHWERVRFSASRLKDEWPYPQEVRAAKALEAIYGETDDGRLERIDAYIHAEDRIQAIAALWQLTANGKNPRINDYLERLSQEKDLPVFLQIHLREALSRRKKEWIGSQGDLQMIERWLSTPWKETAPPWKDPNTFSLASSDESSLFGWLRAIACQTAQFTRLHILDFYIKALANPQRSSKFHSRLLAELRGGVGTQWTPGERAIGEKYLAEAINQRQSPGERRAAAVLLHAFAPFNEAETKALRALLAATKDDTVAKELRALLGE